MPEEFELKSIHGVEVFATGKHNGDKFTDEDLAQIVESFNQTKDRTKPYLKLGHSDTQGLVGKDELPAAGFVENLRKMGNKLICDFVNVPNKIFELIKRKAYSRVSIELFCNQIINGIKHPLNLKAVAMLGGETPAVQTLDDIMALYGNQNFVIEFDSGQEVKNYDYSGGAEMSEEHMKRIGKLEGDLKIFEEENAQLKAELEKKEAEAKEAEAKVGEAEKKAEEAGKEAEEAKAEVAKVEEEKKEAELTAKIEKFVSEGKILPVQGKLASELYRATRTSEKKFSVEEKEYSVSELLDAIIDANDKKFVTDASAEMTQPTGEDAELKKIHDYAKEKGVSFKEALLALSEPNTEDDSSEG